MGTARRILSALIGAAAISLISSCGFGGGETDGVEVRLDPSRVAAAAREAVEGIEENEQVHVKVWAEFLCEYGSEKETREFTLFDKELSHETFDMELNEWTEGHLKDRSSFTIDGLPVGKTVTFTMSIHFKLSGAIDEEFTPYTSDPAMATIGVDRELTLTLRVNEKGHEKEKEIECTITATIPAIPDGIMISDSVAYIWIKENGQWVFRGSVRPGNKDGSTFTFTGSFYANVGEKAKVSIFVEAAAADGGPSNYGLLTDGEFTVSDSGNVFNLGDISTVGAYAPAPAPFMRLRLDTAPDIESLDDGNYSIEVSVFKDETNIPMKTWSGVPKDDLSRLISYINLTEANLSPDGEYVRIEVNIKDSSGNIVWTGSDEAQLGSPSVVPVAAAHHV